MTISQWLSDAAKQLKAVGIESYRLDAEIILAHTLNKSRTFLHAHTTDDIHPRLIDIADTRLSMRLERTPIAYIVGHKHFYGRIFRVTPAVLIPRPESETLIQRFLHYSQTDLRPSILVDVGTGSGCLGITAQLERPQLNTTLIDTSTAALRVAEDNAQRLGARVHTLRSDLLANFPAKADYIIANLPYVDPTWLHSPETNYEPTDALFAQDGGTALITKLLDQSIGKTAPNALIFIEADPEQHDKITAHAKTCGFTLEESVDYCLVFRKD